MELRMQEDTSLLVTTSTGSFKASKIPKITFYMASFSIVACYYISQYYGHDPPFPHAWISDTAGHCPEFIIFRLGTISGATMLILSWFINHFWIHTVSAKANFPVKNYGPIVTLIVGMMGAMGLMGSTANLDTGYRHPHWHNTCAAAFFVLTGLTMIYDTIVMIIMRRARVIKGLGYYLKLFTTFLLLIQLFVNQKYGTGEFIKFGPREGLGSDLDHILEYTSSFTVLFYVYAIGVCVKDYQFSYDLFK